MKEKLTKELLLKKIGDSKKITLLLILSTFTFISIVLGFIFWPFTPYSFINLYSVIFAIYVIISGVIAIKWALLINYINKNQIDIYQDNVKEKTVLRGQKTKHYLVFNRYRHPKEPGVRVNEKEYDICQLTDSYYIICIKNSLSNPHVLVFPDKNYELAEDLSEKVRK